MTKDELIESARMASLFPEGVLVVPLTHVQQFNAAERDALFKIKAELAAILVRIEVIAP